MLLAMLEEEQVKWVWPVSRACTHTQPAMNMRWAVTCIDL